MIYNSPIIIYPNFYKYSDNNFCNFFAYLQRPAWKSVALATDWISKTHGADLAGNNFSFFFGLTL